MKLIMQIKKQLEKIDSETRWGFVFGVIAIIAIIVEMALGSFSADAVVGGVKDAAGTLVAIMVFFVALKALKPKDEDLSFEERFNNALNRFMDCYSKTRHPLTEKKVIIKRVGVIKNGTEIQHGI